MIPQETTVRTEHARLVAVLSIAAALMLTGCTHIGPATVAADRFDYSTAIADSWKQQTLLNIVKLRYMDLPVFVDVSSIVAGYSIETSGNIGGQASSTSAIQGNSLVVGAAGKFTDRPTITYVPMTGEKFLRGLITPIDPKKIFFMLQTGYAADFILGLTVESLNGVRNRSAAGGTVREADPEFIRALELLREMQAVGAFGMKIEEDTARGSTGVLFFRRDDIPNEMTVKADEVRRLLKLAPEQQRFVLTYSPVRGTDTELAVSSRSMLQILKAFASYLEVPEAHLADHSAEPDVGGAGATKQQTEVRIHSGTEEPTSAFTAVHYRDHWFWVDNGDWETKRALTAVMFFFTLAETGANENLPMITIPAQ